MTGTSITRLVLLDGVSVQLKTGLFVNDLPYGVQRFVALISLTAGRVALPLPANCGRRCVRTKLSIACAPPCGAQRKRCLAWSRRLAAP